MDETLALLEEMATALGVPRHTVLAMRRLVERVKALEAELDAQRTLLSLKAFLGAEMHLQARDYAKAVLGVCLLVKQASQTCAYCKERRPFFHKGVFDCGCISF